MYGARDNIDPWYRRGTGTSPIRIASSTSDVEVQDVVSLFKSLKLNLSETKVLYRLVWSSRTSTLHS